MDVSIIYVNYKTCDLLLNSIQSVKKYTSGISYEIIVVDNHSEDSSREHLSRQYADVIYIQSDENLGFGRANNLGMTVARGNCYFFLNPDTLLINNAIKILYDCLESNPKIGACGGNLFDEEGNPTSSFGRFSPSLMQEFLSIFYLPMVHFPQPQSRYFNHSGKPLEVAGIIGADLMVRCEVIGQVGGFDPDFFMNYEETELCYRIRRAGYRILSVPEAQIIHLEGRASYIKQSRLHFLYEGQYIYFSKRYGRRGARRIFRITQLKNNLRILLFRLLCNKRKKDYWQMKKDTNRQVYEQFKKKDA